MANLSLALFPLTSKPVLNRIISYSPYTYIQLRIHWKSDAFDISTLTECIIFLYFYVPSPHDPVRMHLKEESLFPRLTLSSLAICKLEVPPLAFVT